MSILRNATMALFCTAGLMAFAGSAVADPPSIVITQGLAFGGFAMFNNRSVYTITVPANGGLPTYDSAFAPMDLVGAHNAIIQLHDFTPGSQVTIDFDDGLGNTNITLTCPCGGPNLTIDSFTTNPAMPLVIGPSGDATINVGAKLHTSGSGVRYQGTTYSGNLRINITDDM